MKFISSGSGGNILILFIFSVLFITQTTNASSYDYCPSWGNCCSIPSGYNNTICTNICIRQCVCNVTGMYSCCNNPSSWTSLCTARALLIAPNCYYPGFNIDKNCTSKCSASNCTYIYSTTGTTNDMTTGTTDDLTTGTTNDMTTGTTNDLTTGTTNDLTTGTTGNVYTTTIKTTSAKSTISMTSKAQQQTTDTLLSTVILSSSTVPVNNNNNNSNKNNIDTTTLFTSPFSNDIIVAMIVLSIALILCLIIVCAMFIYYRMRTKTIKEKSETKGMQKMASLIHIENTRKLDERRMKESEEEQMRDKTNNMKYSISKNMYDLEVKKIDDKVRDKKQQQQKSTYKIDFGYAYNPEYYENEMYNEARRELENDNDTIVDIDRVNYEDYIGDSPVKNAFMQTISVQTPSNNNDDDSNNKVIYSSLNDLERNNGIIAQVIKKKEKKTLKFLICTYFYLFIYLFIVYYFS